MSNKKYSGMRMKFVSKGIAGYYRYMKYKQSIKLISGNQIVQEKLNIIEFLISMVAEELLEEKVKPMPGI